MVSTKVRYTGDRIDRAAIRAVLGRSSQSKVGRVLRARARRVEQEALRLAPIRSGRLRATVRQVEGRNQRGPYIHITAGGPDVPYLGYVLFGSQPHVIRPVRARVLRFTVGSRVVFARRVQHPGYKGRNFLKLALEAARR